MYNLHDILLYLWRGTCKLQELVSNPFDSFNIICSKQGKDGRFKYVLTLNIKTTEYTLI